MTSFSKYVCWPLILIVQGIISCPPNKAVADDQPPAKQDPTQKFELHLEGERLSAFFRNVPLRDVAKALESKTHAHIRMNDPEIANESVSASVHSSTLKEAMKIILNGFSYALGPSGHGFTVVILSTPPQRFRGIGTTELTCPDNPANMLQANPESPQRPDETRNLMPDTEECNDMITKNIVSLDSESSEDENQKQDVLLQQALDVLNSPQTHLYANAIEQLGMLKDELANATLIKFAQQTREGPERYLATEALTRIAVQSQFKDANVMMVLEQLAVDQNEDVRRSAGLVIEQMHQEELASK
ncbi:MAG: hypothetical protein HOP23_00755 [Methylococcaceae bacterium]|nr:hypothetical protein [Methylococcaceae bacterium]